MSGAGYAHTVINFSEGKVAAAHSTNAMLALSWFGGWESSTGSYIYLSGDIACMTWPLETGWSCHICQNAGLSCTNVTLLSYLVILLVMIQRSILLERSYAQLVKYWRLVVSVRLQVGSAPSQSISVWPVTREWDSKINLDQRGPLKERNPITFSLNVPLKYTQPIYPIKNRDTYPNW